MREDMTARGLSLKSISSGQETLIGGGKGRSVGAEKNLIKRALSPRTETRQDPSVEGRLVSIESHL